MFRDSFYTLIELKKNKNKIARDIKSTVENNTEQYVRWMKMNSMGDK